MSRTGSPRLSTRWAVSERPRCSSAVRGKQFPARRGAPRRCSRHLWLPQPVIPVWMVWDPLHSAAACPNSQRGFEKAATAFPHCPAPAACGWTSNPGAHLENEPFKLPQCGSVVLEQHLLLSPGPPGEGFGGSWCPSGSGDVPMGALQQEGL